MMIKKIAFLFSCCLSQLFSKAQYDAQISIYTDDGIFSILKNEDGKDMILFDVNLWNDIARGTKYRSENLSQPIAACIELANKKQLHCKAGIGFRCSLFDRRNKFKSSVMVNNTQRFCSIIIQQQDSGTVKMIFLDKVDWQDLQSDQ